GNYYGVNGQMSTILEGLVSAVQPGSQIEYKQGALLDRPNINPIDWTTGEAKTTDAILVVLADAVLLTWYPGEEGGNAVADLVFGKASPSGRLPVTFPKSLAQLPAYEAYGMKGRTYRYLEAEPMYPFGYGLSYGKFTYAGAKLSTAKAAKNKPVEMTATVTNTGGMASEEVVQLYLTHPQRAGAQVPRYALKGFQRVRLAPGASTTVKFTLTPEMLALVNAQGQPVAPSGPVTVWVGGSLPSARSLALGAAKPASAVLTVR
nr:probable beta-D-xylosidase 7 [Tanacetum cinerariifolium]